MKIFTYWETLEGFQVPSYVLFCLASMRHQFGDKLVILTPYNVGHYVSDLENSNGWQFHWSDSEDRPVRQVVAKSDYLRMRVVAEHGGMWLDADTVAIAPLPDGFEEDWLQEGKLAWYSEAFFAASSGQELLESAAECMLNSEYQTWGNPGGIKDKIIESSDRVIRLKSDYILPGSSTPYNFANRDLLLSKEIEVDEFLNNPEQFLLIVYNTAFAELDIARMSPIELLSSGTLLARLFLILNDDPDWWSLRIQEIQEELNGVD